MRLLNKYPMDNIKYLAQVAHKILERTLQEEVYKILMTVNTWSKRLSKSTLSSQPLNASQSSH